MCVVAGWFLLLLMETVYAADPMCHHQEKTFCYAASKPMTKDTRCMQAYKKYPQAKEECNKLGMTLAVITSAEQNELVRKLCGEQACYIGLEERANSEDWKWVSGDAMTYTNWFPGQPNNWRPADAGAHIEEDTAAMNCWKGFDGRWCDVNGTQAAIGYVCQRVGNCPAAALALDACELVVEDSLPNIDYNFTSGTCENTPIMNDGGSFCYTSSASSCYIGARQAWDGSCLKGGKIYQQGRSTCRVFGGDLVKISSAEEQKAVQEACGDQMCWIGLSEAIGSEAWTWLDKTGTTLYNNWAPGQPDNGVTKGYDDSHWNKAAVPGYDETVAVMNLIPNMDGKWRDTYEEARFGFVCQVPAKICTEAKAGSFSESRGNVKAVLSGMKECSASDAGVTTKSSSVEVFSFETRCEAKASNSPPDWFAVAGTKTEESDDDSTMVVVIACLVGLVLIMACAVIVLFMKYRQAADTAKTASSLAGPTSYGNSA